MGQIDDFEPTGTPIRVDFQAQRSLIHFWDRWNSTFQASRSRVHAPLIPSNLVAKELIMQFSATTNSWSGSTGKSYALNAFNDGGQSGLVLSEATVMTAPGTFDLLTLAGDATVTSPNAVLTLYVNGVATLLSVSVGAGLTKAQDTTHVISVNAEDLVQFTNISGTDFTAAAMSVRFIPN